MRLPTIVLLVALSVGAAHAQAPTPTPNLTAAQRLSALEADASAKQQRILNLESDIAALKQQVAGRAIGAGARNALVTALAAIKTGATVELVVPARTEEARTLMGNLARAFEDAGWGVTRNQDAAADTDANLVGLKVLHKPGDPIAASVVAALREAGFTVVAEANDSIVAHRGLQLAIGAKQ